MKLSPLKSLLLAAVATAALAGPIAADAQPNPDRSGDREQQQADRKARQEARQKQRAERTAPPTGPAVKGRPGNDRTPGDRVRPGPGNQVDRPMRGNQPDRIRPNQPDRVRPNQPHVRPTPAPRPEANPAGRRPLTPERQRVRRNAQTQIQRSFNRNRWQQDFRRRHHDRRWWRNDRRFRGWNGIRIGFYFAPGFGYYSVPRQYYNQHYYAGSYLPSFFWRYRVSDYNYWGLPPAPPGTAWIYVNNWILLVDLWDGYIIEAIPDAWYW